MYVDLRSGIGRGLFMKGEFDPAVFEPLRPVLKRGDVFLDVGANVGYYSMLALDLVGGRGTCLRNRRAPAPVLPQDHRAREDFQPVPSQAGSGYH